MARKKEYDPTIVLDKAMHLFWQQGYTTTSIGDLVESTGVQRYGLYDSFTDKHTLFLQALDHYQETMVSYMVQSLVADKADWNGITAFFERLLMASQTPEGQHGCLMCNSAIELATHDTAVAAKMSFYKTYLFNLFEQAITRAQAQGQLGLQVEAEKAAIFLVGTAIGLFTIAKTQAPLTTLTQYVEVALTGLHALSYT